MYFHFKPEMLESISNLNGKVNKSLFKPILEDDNEINFFSWLSEMKFGLFFDSLNFELEYNTIINKQTPDWKLKKNNEVIYAEVLRLNLQYDLTQKQIEEFKNQYRNRDKPKTPVFESYSSGEMNMEYFYAKKSKLTDKEFRYRSLVDNCKSPFILCVDCSEPKLFLDYLDFDDYFIGGKKGFFYTDKDFGKNVSGILIRTMWNQTLFLNNPNALHKVQIDALRDLNAQRKD